MDYLVIEGYKSAAEEFSKETGLQHSVDLSTIETRMHIREAVQRGDVEQAIELVNNINPSVSSRLSSHRSASCSRRSPLRSRSAGYRPFS